MANNYKISEQTSKFLDCLQDLDKFHNDFMALLDESKASEESIDQFAENWSNLQATCLNLTMRHIQEQVNNYFTYKDAKPEL